MSYTSHGHHIAGTSTEDPPATRNRCGGPGLCAPCSREAAVQASNKTDTTWHDQNTLMRAHEALVTVGRLSDEAAWNVIGALLKAGIVLRKRA